MPVFKCKMCGGALEIQNNETVAACEYCGTKQTTPVMDDEKKVALFNRANRLRLGCEFDKAANIYESIVAEFPEEAEAYWGLVLCKYGIEYVDDPATAKKIPTCHRSSFDSVFDDSNYELVIENSNTTTRVLYRTEAKYIEELRKNIIEVSVKEDPYDIFICYKETSDDGDRTIDSVIAQDVYTELTNNGYRVFFSRITLEDKLGQEYEPYIFAALSSAKIMLAFGSDYEYYNAVWVKNEWSRFLQLIASGEKKTLIPCYKGIDAYDMPKEFAKLQAQDMGKIGAIQDLLRGIEKILPPPGKKSIAAAESNEANAIIAPLIKRVFMFLSDGAFESADEYCEKVLDLDPECAEAYLGKLMVECRVTRQEELALCDKPFCSSDNYQKVLRFADPKLSKTINDYSQTVDRHREERKRQARYEALVQQFKNAQTKADYMKIIDVLEQSNDIEDINNLKEQCRESIKPFTYTQALELLHHNNSIDDVRQAKEWLLDIIDYSDVKKHVEVDCQRLEEVYALITKLDIPDFLSVLCKIKQVKLQSASLHEEKEKLCAQLNAQSIATQSVTKTDNEKNAITNLLNGFTKKVKNKLTDYTRDSTSTQQPKQTRPLNIAETEQKISDIDQRLLQNKLDEDNLIGQIETEKRTQIIQTLLAPETFSFLRTTPHAPKVKRMGDILRFAEMFQNSACGTSFTFGSYHDEPLKWVVVAQSDFKALAVCKNMIDFSPFKRDGCYEGCSWEKSDVRKYLNATFYDKSFDIFEQNLIAETVMESSKNPQYDTSFDGGCADKVFLLSVEDTVRYFPTERDRKCLPTRKLQEITLFDHKHRYWLRTPGSELSKIAFVDHEGKIDYSGDFASIRLNAIRPALYIDQGKIYDVKW